MANTPGAPAGLTSAALRGAVDLGALAQARQAQEQAAQAAANGVVPGGGFVIDVTGADFEAAVLQQSLTVPVVLDLWATWCEPCKQLSPVLESLAAEYAGRFVLAKVDVDAEQQIGAAFQVQSIPSVFAVVKGQPIPLFQGALPAAQVRQYLEELLKVAAENGVTGRATPVAGPGADPVGRQVAAESMPVEDPADAMFQAAGDAMAADDWAGAERIYRELLETNPNDPDARAGLVVVDLQKRLAGVDPGAALIAADADPADVDKAITAADVQAAGGDAEGAYSRLVRAVRLAPAEERNRARARLLELFHLAAPDDPLVTKTRRALAAALF